MEVSIYHVAGRLVRALPFEQRSAGDRLVEWDGRDGAGRAMPSGIYLVRLEAEGLTASRKVTLAR